MATLTSTLQCPQCSLVAVEQMPVDACVAFLRVPRLPHLAIAQGRLLLRVLFLRWYAMLIGAGRQLP